MKIGILFALLLFIGVVSADLTTGLVAKWGFDEGTGTFTNDTSGNLNNGTLINGTSWLGNANGVRYSDSVLAANFNGTNNYIDVGNSSLLNIASENFTISAWTQTNISGVDHAIVSKTNPAIFYPGIDLRWDSDDKLRLSVYNSSADGITALSSVLRQVNVWQHITVTWNGTYACFYINGILDSCSAGAFPLNPNNIYNLTIGKGTGQSAFMNGSLERLEIWNRTLSSAEIWDDYLFFGCPFDIIIKTYNETSISEFGGSLQQINLGITLSNSTGTSQTQLNIVNFSNYYCSGKNTIIPQNDVKISVSNSSFFSPRYYYITLVTGGTYSLGTYLLPLDDLYGISTTIIVSNGVGGVVPGALVSIYKNIGGVDTVIAQDTADGVGQTRFNLDAQTNYLLIANATGYTQVSFNFQPSQAVYTITLQNSNASTSLFNCSTCGVTWNMTPTGYLVTGTVNFNFSIYDSYNDLSFWGMNVSYNGSSQYFVNETTASGGSVNYTMNTSLTDGVNVTIFFYRNGTFFDPTYQFGTYTFIAGNYSLINAMAALGTSGLSPLTKSILAIVLITCIAGYVGTSVSFGGGVIIEMLGLWFLSSIGYIGFLQMVMLTMLGSAIVYNRWAALTPAG